MKYTFFGSVVFLQWIVCVSSNYTYAENNETSLNDVSYRSHVVCSTDSFCEEYYTPGYDYASQIGSSLIQAPYCEFDADGNGYCTCADNYCKSRSEMWNSTEFYYCGPCERIGSSCNSADSCEGTAYCYNGYCWCQRGGHFYETFYCFVPYYGYDLIVQLVVTTGLVIVFCFLIARVYYMTGMEENRRLQAFRNFITRNNGRMHAPPGDDPPKYEDVAEGLPTYEAAVDMAEDSAGISNQAYIPDQDTQSTTQNMTGDVIPSENITGDVMSRGRSSTEREMIVRSIDHTVNIDTKFDRQSI